MATTDIPSVEKTLRVLVDMAKELGQKFFTSIHTCYKLLIDSCFASLAFFFFSMNSIFFQN